MKKFGNADYKGGIELLSLKSLKCASKVQI